MNNISFLLSDYEKGLKLIEQKIKEYITDDFKVVVISWAFPNELNYELFENEWFKYDSVRYHKYIDSLINLGIKLENINVLNCYDKKNYHAFKDILKKSDMIVLCGGNPEMLYSKVVQETELLYDIKYYQGIILGFSAGADLQFKRYFITAKNNYYKYFAFYDGFGVLDDPFYLDVHSIKNRFYLDKLQKVANDKRKNVYAIFNDGALMYNRDNKQIEKFGKIIELNPEE